MTQESHRETLISSYAPYGKTPRKTAYFDAKGPAPIRNSTCVHTVTNTDGQHRSLQFDAELEIGGMHRGRPRIGKLAVCFLSFQQ